MKATQLKASGHDNYKRNKLKYYCEDTVTIDCAEEEGTDRTTMTGFEGGPLHPRYATTDHRL